MVRVVDQADDPVRVQAGKRGVDGGGRTLRRQSATPERRPEGPTDLDLVGQLRVERRM